MSFKDDFPSLRGLACRECRSPDVSESFSIPEYMQGRLFDSRNIEKYCVDKAKVKEAINKAMMALCGKHYQRRADTKMKILGSVWYTNLVGQTNGIVYGKNIQEEKAYIGVGRGESEEEDAALIANRGAPFPVKQAKELLGVP